MKLAFGLVQVSADLCGRPVISELENSCLSSSRLVDLAGNCTRPFTNVSALKTSSKMWERIEKHANLKRTSLRCSIRGCGILLGLSLICTLITSSVSIFVT